MAPTRTWSAGSTARLAWHMVLFSVVFPLLGAWGFLVGKYIIHHPDMSFVHSMASGLLGALIGLLFVLIPALVVATAWIPLILFGSKRHVVAVTLVGLPAATIAFFCGLWRDSFFCGDWPILLVVSLAVSVLASALYARTSIYELWPKQ